MGCQLAHRIILELVQEHRIDDFDEVARAEDLLVDLGRILLVAN